MNSRRSFLGTVIATLAGKDLIFDLELLEIN